MRLEKGSKEAIEWGKKMKSLREQKKMISGGGASASVVGKEITNTEIEYLKALKERHRFLTNEIFELVNLQSKAPTRAAYEIMDGRLEVLKSELAFVKEEIKKIEDLPYRRKTE
jgi:hypothetical protein